MQDHILHFYHLAALDYVNVADVASYDGKDSQLNSVKDFIQRGALEPFLPRYEGDYRLPPEVNQAAVAHYVQALEMRRTGHEAVAIFSGKVPHLHAARGGSAAPNGQLRANILTLDIIQVFLNNVPVLVLRGRLVVEAGGAAGTGVAP